VRIEPRNPPPPINFKVYMYVSSNIQIGHLKSLSVLCIKMWCAHEIGMTSEDIMPIVLLLIFKCCPLGESVVREGRSCVIICFMISKIFALMVDR